VLDADRLGGRAQGASGSDAVVQEITHLDPVYGKAAFWGGDGGYMYLMGNGELTGSGAGRLRAFARTVSAGGRPRLAAAGTAAEPFGYASGSPIVTSDG